MKWLLEWSVAEFKHFLVNETSINPARLGLKRCRIIGNPGLSGYNKLA